MAGDGRVTSLHALRTTPKGTTPGASPPLLLHEYVPSLRRHHCCHTKLLFFFRSRGSTGSGLTGVVDENEVFGETSNAFDDSPSGDAEICGFLISKIFNFVDVRRGRAHTKHDRHCQWCCHETFIFIFKFSKEPTTF